jgi:hypothetical protein
MAVNIIDYLRTRGLTKEQIIKFIKKHKHIVYGSTSINAQSSFPLIRHSSDFDIFTKSPNRSANELDRKLDKTRGGDYHYVKPAIHKGTFKVMDIGFDLKPRTEDDFNLADFSRIPRNLKIKIINGIRYASLDFTKKTKQRILKNKKFDYRHKKDREDLKLIEAIENRKWWL